MKNHLLLIITLLLLLIGCQKNNDTPTPPTPPNPAKSSNKTISSFIFRSANNTNLSTDIVGSIGNDSIFCVLPSGINVNSLVPTILTNGISIFPNNLTAQDFSNPVTYTVNAEDGSSKKYIIVISFLNSNHGTIYIGSESQSSNPIGYLYAIDALTGNMKWKYTTGSIYGSATFSNGTVYVGEQKGLLAIDGNNGTLRWEYNTTNWIRCVPTVINGIVYFGCNDKYLYAVNANTGVLIWKSLLDFTTVDASSSSPTVVNGIVYIGGEVNNFYAFDANTGNLKWKSLLGDAIQSSPTVVNGIVYVGCLDGNLYAFDAISGTLKWKHRTGIIFSSPTVVNGIVYVGSFDGLIYAIDAITGLEKWKYFTTIIYSSPTIVNGVLYIGLYGQPKFIALDALSGNLKWSQTYDNDFDARGATVFNGVVYVSNTNLLALDANNGNLKWKFLVGYNEDITADPCIVDSLGNIYHPGISGDHN